MVNEYKEIVLIKGLEKMKDYPFRKIKSLLRKELNLTKAMQDDYDRIQLSDLLEDKYPKDAGLDKLIEVCERIEELQDLTNDLKREKAKVQKKKKKKGKTAVKKRKQDEPSTSESNKNKPSSKKKRKQSTKTEGGKKKKLTQDQTQLPECSGSNIKEEEGCLQTPQKPPPTPPSISSNMKKRKQITKTEGGKKKKLTHEQTQLPECSGTDIKDEDCLQTPQKPPPTPPSISSNKTPRRGAIPKEPAREEGHHQGPKQVMVLKVTEPFVYDMREDKRMFHATVATETEFFRVKVFNTALKSKFVPRKIIAISNYFGCNGFLEIYTASCVSDVNINQTMVIPNTLRQRANATPKISYLFSQPIGTFVNGEFVVVKKTERNDFIYYGIEDDTGKMEVVVYGRHTNIKCEPGSKLRLVCFELTSTEDSWQLKCGRHSYMQVINART